MKRFRPGLTVSILAFVSCLLLSAWLLFSFLAFKTAANDLYAQKGDHARLLLTTFISQLPESLPTYPTGIIAPDSPAAVYIGKLSDDAAFTRLTLLDVNDKVVYTVGRDAAEIYLPFEGKNPLGQGVFVLDGERGIACVAPSSVVTFADGEKDWTTPCDIRTTAADLRSAKPVCSCRWMPRNSA